MQADSLIEKTLHLLKKTICYEFQKSLPSENSMESIYRGVEFLIEKINSQKKRINEITELILEVGAGNLNVQMPVSESRDEIDVISEGINTFLEEIKDNTVSIDKLIEANSIISEKEKKLYEAQKLAKVGSWEYSYVNDITNWSDELYNIFGLNKDEEINFVQILNSRIHQEDYDQFDDLLVQLSQVKQTIQKEFRIILDDQTIKHILATIQVQFNDKNEKIKIIGTFQDISERKFIEQKQIELEQLKLEQKKKIIEAILITKEKEQKRFAEELHDDIGSSLMLVKFAIDKQKISKENKQEIFELIGTITKKIRLLSNELSPNILEEFGLINALIHYIQTVRQNTLINISLNYNEEDTSFLTKEEEISIFRIVQELLSNILKYADSKIVEIDLELTENEFIISVQDDGSGYIPKVEDKLKSSFGLLNIESRVEFIKARIEYCIIEPKGTKVLIKKSL